MVESPQLNNHAIPRKLLQTITLKVDIPNYG
jgi:hypothetical protein